MHSTRYMHTRDSSRCLQRALDAALYYPYYETTLCSVQITCCYAYKFAEEVSADVVVRANMGLGRTPRSISPPT